MLTDYSAKWFTVYYLLLGLLCLAGGIYALFKSGRITAYIEEQTSPDNPPPRIRIFLRYFLFFTIPTLLFSFFPFSLIELAFSIWCLVMIFLIGSMLVRWKSIQPLILEQSTDVIKKYIRLTGAIMLSLGLVMLLLFYRIIQTMAINS